MSYEFELQAIVRVIESMTPDDAKGTLAFITGYMSNRPAEIWSAFREAIEASPYYPLEIR